MGDPWTYIAPAAGFGVGLLADMKYMHKTHKDPHEKTENDESHDLPPVTGVKK
jgi:hypothetical protein